MDKNNNLHKARGAKNDEFYTQLSDIENELKHYRWHFRGKVILCNCDDPARSAFWEYFHLHFGELGLKGLVSTHYEQAGPTYKMEYGGGDDHDTGAGIKTPLEGNGDFRSQECLDLLDRCDIVVTNPPFSLARDYIDVLMGHGKKFLIIGDLNWVTYKEVFPLVKDNKMWLGYSPVKGFLQPDGSIRKFGNKLWYTNLDIAKRHEKLALRKEYSLGEYPKYHNYDAINVDKITDIPADYGGVMGVPITFLGKYSPEQFEILGMTLGATAGYGVTAIYENATQHNRDGSTQGGSKANTRAAILVKDKPVDKVYYTADNVDGYLTCVYPRVLIKRREL